MYPANKVTEIVAHDSGVTSEKGPGTQKNRSSSWHVAFDPKASEERLGRRPNSFCIQPTSGNTHRDGWCVPTQRSALSCFLLRSELLVKRLQQVEETFYCKICLENCPKKNQHQFSARTDNCNHYFCAQCLTGELTQNIMEGTTRIRCPLDSEDRCGNFSTVEDVRLLCNPKVLQKFERFLQMKDDENMRECPFCEHFQHGDPLVPEMICEKCQKKFCFFHSNAHSSEESCADFTRKSEVIERQSISTMKKIGKQCPACKRPIQKNGGCNHMSCPCGNHWCWLCGQTLGTQIDKHYMWWNIWGCAGAQFQNDRISAFLSCYRAYVVFVIVFGCFLQVILFCFMGIVMSLCLFISKELRDKRWGFFKDIWNVAMVPAAGFTFLTSMILATGVSITSTIFVVTFLPIKLVVAKVKHCPSIDCRKEVVDVATLPFSIVSVFFRIWQSQN